MSRGAGRWQRAILEACDTAPEVDGIPAWVSLETIGRPDRCGTTSTGETLTRSLEGAGEASGQLTAGATLSRAQRVAIARAMRALDLAGRIQTRLLSRPKQIEMRSRTFTYDDGIAASVEMPVSIGRAVLHARRPLTHEQECTVALRGLRAALTAAQLAQTEYVRDLALSWAERCTELGIPDEEIVAGVTG